MSEILVVSDSHLSLRTPEAQANWETVVNLIDRQRPDLVVHTGDLSLDGMRDPGELRLAREQLDRLPVPWLAVPGNHDIGDIGGTDNPIDDKRRQAFAEIIGPSFWSHRLGGWRLIGIDSQELLSDAVRGQALIDRLASEVTGPHPIVLFQHRPLLAFDDPDGDTARRYVVGPVRTPLRALMARPEVKLAVSGHVHQWRTHTIDETEHVWAPSTWAAMTADWQPVIGTKVVGVVRIVLDDEVKVGDTGSGVKAELIVPDGITDNVLGETLASPYNKR